MIRYAILNKINHETSNFANIKKMKFDRNYEFLADYSRAHNFHIFKAKVTFDHSLET